MSSLSNGSDQREKSLVDVEVLDFGPLYQQAVEHYVSLQADRAQWSQAKRSRLIIRTECRWGRINLENECWYLLNEKGEGPRDPLSTTSKAFVALYAEMPPSGSDAGFYEPTPFCKVAVDVNLATTLRVIGIVALEEFIRTKIPEMEAAYQEWRATLQKERARILAARARRAEKAATPNVARVRA